MRTTPGMEELEPRLELRSRSGDTNKKGAAISSAPLLTNSTFYSNQ